MTTTQTTIENGTWVVNTETNHIKKISVLFEEQLAEWNENLKNGDYRLATTNEIQQEQKHRKFKAVGRRLGEFCAGDIVSSPQEGVREVIAHPQKGLGIFQTEDTFLSFCDLPVEPENYFQLVCSKKMRLDN